MRTYQKIFSMTFCWIMLYSYETTAILLGESDVPRDHFIVYLGIGHSNFAGRNITTADTIIHPRTWNYKWYGSNTFPQTPYDSVWIPAQEKNGGPLSGKPDGYSGLTPRGTGGPCLPFIKEMAKRHPEYHIGIITNATSSSCVKINPPPPPSGYNNYTKGSGDRYDEIIGFAKKVKDQVTIGGVICMFGEPEVSTGNNASANTFSADVKKLFEDIRSDLGMPELPIIIGCYEEGATGAFATTTSRGSIISKAIKALPAAVSFCDTVSSAGCSMLDDHHFDYDGQKLWAQRAADCIVTNKWFSGTGSINRIDNGMSLRKENGYKITYNKSEKSLIVSGVSSSNTPMISLYNLQGRMLPVHKHQLSSTTLKFSLSGCISGSLIVRIVSDDLILYMTKINVIP